LAFNRSSELGDRGRSVAEQTPKRQLEVPLRQPMQVQLRQKLPDLTGPAGEQRQDPAQKPLLQTAHSRAADRDDD
jgi:hypothetical protein